MRIIINNRLFILLGNLLAFVLILCPFSAQAQDRSYIKTTTYDENETVIGESKVFYDKLGKQIQTQTRVISDNRVIGVQSLYDVYGRKVLESLPAPVNQNLQTGELEYDNKFLTNWKGENYSHDDFDRKEPHEIGEYTNNGLGLGYLFAVLFSRVGMVNTPSPVDNKENGTVGHYYSDNNVQEPYVPTTTYPYTRIEYDDNNLGALKRSALAGDNLHMGKGHESQTYSMTSFNELDYLYGKGRSWFLDGISSNVIYAKAATNNRVIKTISVDANGKEMVSFSSPGGKMLATCLSGQVDGSNITTKTVEYNSPVFNVSTITAIRNGSTSRLDGEESGSQFVDVHLPEGCENSLILLNGEGQNHTRSITYKFLDLKSGEFVKFGNEDEFSGTKPNLPPGYYRIIWVRGGKMVKKTIVAPNGLSYKIFSIYTTTFSFRIIHDVNYYNFAINYYDYAGRLKLSVPPAGVDNAYVPTTSSYPAHRMYELFGDNTVNNYYSYSPDRGYSVFLYRKDGQIRYSKNAVQIASNVNTALQRFSYSSYDKIGRIVETGEYDPNIPNAEAIAVEFVEADVTKILDSKRCTNQSYIRYDVADVNDFVYNQQFLNGKVAKTWNENSTTWYSYDELGRLAWTVQEMKNILLGQILGDSKFFTFNYTYDFNGNITKVEFQKGNPNEDFTYFYEYDQDKRLKRVLSSVDAGITKQEQSEYSYYIHGPLKRVELANNSQGIDYVYTINGWLKSINSPELANRDPGKDGTAASSSNAPADLFGMTLDYFADDYKRANTNIQTYAGGEDLFDGTIKAQRWQTHLPNALASPNLTYKNSQLYYGYTYDNKYQLTSATFAQVNNIGSKNGGLAYYKGGTPTIIGDPLTNFNDYSVNISYDLNGNIKYLQRNGANGLGMDFLEYHYKESSGNLVNNQLSKVTDFNTENNYGPGFEIKNGQLDDNYVYNEIGQQVEDNNPDKPTLTTYDIYGKVTSISSAINPTNDRTIFTYDEKGQRIQKTSILSEDLTWYVRDAAGNVFSVYKPSPTGDWLQKEINIYGTNRIGVYDVTADKYTYELTDHLGNVRTTFMAESGGEDQIISTSFDENGEDDYNFIFSGEFDNNFDRLNQAAPNSVSQKLSPGKNGAYSSKIAVKQNQVITGSIYTFCEVGANPQAQLIVGLFDDLPNWNVLDFKINSFISTGGVWVKHDFTYTVPVDGYLAVFLNNNNSASDIVWMDDLAINFGPEGSQFAAQSFADYYPFGAVMPGRESNSSFGYRYGYQGQFSEKDPETGLNTFELRNYSALLGRWSVTDPYNAYHTSYNGMGNNPTNLIDADGGAPPDEYTGIWNSTTQEYEWSQTGNKGGSETDYFYHGGGKNDGKTFVFGTNNSYWINSYKAQNMVFTLTNNFFSGTGPEYSLHNGDDFANSMRDAFAVNAARKFWHDEKEAGRDMVNNPVTGYVEDFGIPGLIRAEDDLVEQFVGGYRIKSILLIDNNTLQFRITNETSVHSLTNGAIESHSRAKKKKRGSIYQVIMWNENID